MGQGHRALTLCALTKAIMQHGQGRAPWGCGASFSGCLLSAKYSCPINFLLNFIGKQCSQRESAILGPRPNSREPSLITDSSCLSLTFGQWELKNKELLNSSNSAVVRTVKTTVPQNIRVASRAVFSPQQRVVCGLLLTLLSPRCGS